jgi:hypothetical protein
MNTKDLLEKQEARMAHRHNPYLFLESEEFENFAMETGVGQKQLYFATLQNPQAYSDIFGEDEQPHQTPLQKASGKIPALNIEGAKDVAISRVHLEQLLDEVLGLYKSHMTRPDWGRVSDYRSEFLDAAVRKPEVAQRVVAGLERLKFSLMPGEKVVFHRAPAERIIDELKRLLV